MLHPDATTANSKSYINLCNQQIWISFAKTKWNWTNFKHEVELWDAVLEVKTWAFVPMSIAHNTLLQWTLWTSQLYSFTFFRVFLSHIPVARSLSPSFLGMSCNPISMAPFIIVKFEKHRWINSISYIIQAQGKGWGASRKKSAHRKIVIAIIIKS